MINKNEKMKQDTPFASQLELRTHLINVFSKAKTIKYDLRSITPLR
jgi:hypothetical protein